MKHLFLLIFTFILAGSLKAQSPEGAAGPVAPKEWLTELKAFPNPNNSGIFQIEFTATEAVGSINIKVYNLIGKEVHSEKLYVRTFNGKINVSDLPKGVYILEISNGQQKQTKRLSYV
ncbi:MAG: T9SS type A sorting domain-containing protein [Bacteroidia bacterium]